MGRVCEKPGLKLTLSSDLRHWYSKIVSYLDGQHGRGQLEAPEASMPPR